MATTVKKIKLPRPLDHQLPILKSPARFKVPTCGRRFGKSTIGLVASIQGHGPQCGLRGAIDGASILWVCPTYPMSNDTWRSLKRATEGAWQDKSEVERRIELPGGGSIMVRSGDDPQSLRGSGYDGTILDECAFLDERVWSEAVRPTLSDRRGWALFCSTPHGLNWYADLFRQADSMPGWERWQLPTHTNPLIPPEELEVARNEMGSLAFAQEYEAQFVSASAGIFQRDWFPIVVDADLAERTVRYWDLAASIEGDWTVGVRMSRTGDGRHVVEDVKRGRWTPFERDKIIRQTAEADGSMIEVGLEQEPGSAGVSVADSLIRLLAGYCVRAYRPTGSKSVRAQPFAAQCEAGNVSLVRAHWNKDYLDELSRFPAGKHDDQVDSSAGCFSCLTADVHRFVDGELLCSGEDPVEERRTFTDEELAELPPFWQELLTEMRVSAREKADWDDNRRDSW